VALLGSRNLLATGTPFESLLDPSGSMFTAERHQLARHTVRECHIKISDEAGVSTMMTGMLLAS
jgi:hypothetical protein